MTLSLFSIYKVYVYATKMILRLSSSSKQLENLLMLYFSLIVIRYTIQRTVQVFQRSGQSSLDYIQLLFCVGIEEFTGQYDRWFKTIIDNLKTQ